MSILYQHTPTSPPTQTLPKRFTYLPTDHYYFINCLYNNKRPGFFVQYLGLKSINFIYTTDLKVRWYKITITCISNSNSAYSLLFLRF